jgi:hypothetical protein
MKVIITCEFSGRVRDAFIAALAAAVAERIALHGF